ncbi:MAG TPA: transporter substrate-binding domain-containing protein [Gammaproteobacteria bacterium]|nr:transporter substrate-binding domain-containing protein [Gammaproteobacteria bacterium]
MFTTAICFSRLLIACLILAAASVQADVLEDILERGTLRVGVSLFSPWTIQDAADGLSGFEIDVADKLAGDMGVKPEYKVYIWGDIIPAVMKGEIDIIAGGMAITPERALKINFSQPYADSGISLATNTGMTRDIERLEELNQKSISIAVVSKTAANELTTRLFNKSTVMVFDTAREAEEAVLNGKAHAWVASMPQPEFLALQYPDKVDVPLSKPILPYKAGFGIKKGEQEWLNFLNAWVTARNADKWLSATHKYWFNSLNWRKDSKQ